MMSPDRTITPPNWIGASSVPIRSLVQRSDGQAPAEDGEFVPGDGFDIPHGAIHRKTDYTGGLRRHSQYFAPGSREHITTQGSHNDYAGFGRRHRLVQHQVVAWRTRGGSHDTTEPCPRPSRTDGRIHHAAVAGGFVERGGVEAQEAIYNCFVI